MTELLTLRSGLRFQSEMLGPGPHLARMTVWCGEKCVVRELTPDELREIADVAIERWIAFREKIQ